jgi:transcriptional regulator with XRE-family HTH domain
MTKEEFKAARLSLGLSQAELAEALGKSTPRMVVHYEAGTVKVPKSVKLMMDRLLKEKGLTP